MFECERHLLQCIYFSDNVIYVNYTSSVFLLLHDIVSIIFLIDTDGGASVISGCFFFQ